MPKQLAVAISWASGVQEELVFEYLHHGAWRDAYVNDSRQLILKTHLAPGATGKVKPSSANRGEYELALAHPALPKPAVHGCFDASVDIRGRLTDCYNAAPFRGVPFASPEDRLAMRWGEPGRRGGRRGRRRP